MSRVINIDMFDIEAHAKKMWAMSLLSEAVGKWGVDACEKLGEIAKEEAESRYAEYEEPTDISVTVTRLNDGAIVAADGNDVGFAEYGTGCYADPDGTWSDDIQHGRGTWSQTNGTGQYIRNNMKYWYDNNGVRHIGTRPARGMIHGWAKAMDEAQEVCEEVMIDGIDNWAESAW